MADYPGSERERRFAPALLREVTGHIFAACGMSAPDAHLLAESLVHADLRGIHSHGLLRVGDYVGKLLDEGVDSRGRPRVVSQSGAALVVDGGNAMGQVAAAFAMRHAIERARDLHVTLAAVRGSNHCGALDFYTMMALEADMIGVAATNALPTMAPWGGAERIVGINPLSVAIPSAEERPVVMDLSMGATAHGRIRVYAQKGEPIPPGWALDAQGRPTTDAAAALEGLIQPIGGYKGVALGMVLGMLASLLSGAAYGTETGSLVDGPIPGADGHFFLAINVAAFQPVAEFKRRVDAIVREVHAARRAPAVERLYVPGELEAELAERNGTAGVPLNEETLRVLSACGDRVGVDVGPLRPAPDASAR